MVDPISWVATAATVLAASMVAANLGSRVTGYGFVVFTLGALLWAKVGIASHQPALVWTNVVLTALNLFGIWRWLGRQTGVEEGARAASEASERIPGEALFPVSLLSRAPVLCGETEVGNCIEAMAGCSSGQLRYVVVSQGGVAGVGETLRQVPWAIAKVEGEQLIAMLEPDQLDTLEKLPRDQWPAR
ncbi:MAG: PRC-barrel domain containing protein [Sphingomicrobium sp.]